MHSKHPRLELEKLHVEQTFADKACRMFCRLVVLWRVALIVLPSSTRSEYLTNLSYNQANQLLIISCHYYDDSKDSKESKEVCIKRACIQKTDQVIEQFLTSRQQNRRDHSSFKKIKDHG